MARYEQFLLFPQCFLPFWRTLSQFYKIQNCRLQTLSVWKNLKFVVSERDIQTLTLYHTIPTFNNPEKEVFRKHCGNFDRLSLGRPQTLIFQKSPGVKRLNLFSLMQQMSFVASQFHVQGSDGINTII